MKSVEFCYWLQGFFEISGKTEALTFEQTEIIKRHLQLVFKHEIDPSYPNQKELNKIHSGKQDVTFCDPLPDREVLIRC